MAKKTKRNLKSRVLKFKPRKSEKKTLVPEGDNLSSYQDAKDNVYYPYVHSENNMRISNFKQIIVKDLEKCSSAIPTSVRELWWLALAVGYGRLLAYNEDVKTILSRAEKTLTKVKPEIVEQLAASLDWPCCIEGIASGLKYDYPDELEAVLVAFEELLVIADAIEEQETSRIFSQQAGELLAWLPAKWDHIIDFAGSRCEIFNEIDSSAGLFWANIEEALLGAVMRESETDIRPEPRLANVVLPPSKTEVVKKSLDTIPDQPSSILDSSGQPFQKGANLVLVPKD